MKKLIVFLFMFGMMGLAAMAQPPGIRKPVATASPTPPPIRKLTPEQEMARRQGYFAMNTSFVKDKPYYSEDKRYYFVFQSDGNLVIYKVAGSKAIWQNGSSGKAIKSCVFQGDGNLVLYDYAGKAKWAAGQNQRPGSFMSSGPKFMVMQNDGNLVIYDNVYPDTSSPMWASNSFEKNQ